MPAPVFDRLLSTRAMCEIFSARTFVQGLLDFEAALARAQAAEGIVPAAAAAAIAACCSVERFDLDAIVDAGAVAGTLAIPLVSELTLDVARTDTAAAGYVHWGSTSQDVMDTAMVLATRRALTLIDARLADLIAALSGLAQRYRDAPMLGRTLQQPALVISFGFKLVSWVAPLVRCSARLQRAGQAACKLQLGGAVGTLSVLGDAGVAVGSRMAADLQLGHAPGSWHTQRDEWVALGCEVGVLCGALGKIGKDIALLAQGEVGEVAEPGGGGRGGSSAMPHKRNPVAAMVAIAAAVRAPQRVAALLAAMPQEHERGLGNWQAELAEWPGLFMAAHGALNALADAAAGLTVDTARMRRNIDAQHGLVFAQGAAMLLAPHVGQARAHTLLEACVQQAAAGRRQLLDVALQALAADAALRQRVTPDALRAVFDADAAARQASAVAEPQWAALRADPS